jgi:hypothetical protein
MEQKTITVEYWKRLGVTITPLTPIEIHLHPPDNELIEAHSTETVCRSYAESYGHEWNVLRGGDSGRLADLQKNIASEFDHRGRMICQLMQWHRRLVQEVHENDLQQVKYQKQRKKLEKTRAREMDRFYMEVNELETLHKNKCAKLQRISTDKTVLVDNLRQGFETRLNAATKLNVELQARIKLLEEKKDSLDSKAPN